MFAAKAGARLVYAVDACPTICDLAKELIRTNHFQDRIRVINKRIEEIDKFDENIDIIISEWMGKCSIGWKSFLLIEKSFSSRILSSS